MANAAELVVRVTSDVKGAQQGLKSVGQTAGGMKGKLGAASKLAAGALLGIGAAAITAGKAAAEDAQSQAILANAMKNSTGASQAQIAATEAQISKMSAASGVADDQLRPAMGNLVRATGDATKAHDALGVALDVSAATGQDVESVSKAMAKAYAGNTASLGKLVPGMDKGVLASKDMNKILGELARTTGGASAAAADTAAGRMQRMQVAMNEAQESIGAALLPAMSGLATILTKVADAAGAHPGVFKAIAIAVAVVAAAIFLLNTAVGVYQAVMVIAGAVSGAAWAAALWPVLLVIAAIAAVIAIVVLLWNKFPPFKNAVIATWNGIRAAAVAVANWVRTAWSATFAFLRSAFAVVASVFRAIWNGIRAAAAAVAVGVRAVWAAVFNALRAYVNAWRAVITAVFNAVRAVASAVAASVQAIWARVFGALKAAASGVASALSGPFHVVAGAINAVIGAVQSLIGWLGRIKVPHISLPKLPGMKASAPAVASRTAAGTRVGAVGAPVPLGLRAGRSVASGAPTIIIQGAWDPERTARQVQRLLGGHTQRVGLTGALAVT